jgi:hypothetical protein
MGLKGVKLNCKIVIVSEFRNDKNSTFYLITPARFFHGDKKLQSLLDRNFREAIDKCSYYL